MAHFGSLETQPVSDSVRDIRGTIVRGSDGEPLGKIDDVIFDHDTMGIRYLVLDSSDWLKDATFLLGADRVTADLTHDDGLASRVTRQRWKMLRNMTRNRYDLKTSGRNSSRSSRSIGQRIRRCTSKAQTASSSHPTQPSPLRQLRPPRAHG